MSRASIYVPATLIQKNNIPNASVMQLKSLQLRLPRDYLHSRRFMSVDPREGASREPSSRLAKQARFSFQCEGGEFMVGIRLAQGSDVKIQKSHHFTIRMNASFKVSRCG